MEIAVAFDRRLQVEPHAGDEVERRLHVVAGTRAANKRLNWRDACFIISVDVFCREEQHKIFLKVLQSVLILAGIKIRSFAHSMRQSEVLD